MNQPAPIRRIIEPLSRQHDRAAFCCGNEILDRYLKQQASQDSRKNVSAPFVLLERGSNVVKGYYTLSMTGVDPDSLPEDLARKMPKYPLIPAILLGRLAVDLSCQGTGAGRVLVYNALKRSLKSEIAWTAIVVDAIDPAAINFYMHYGLLPFRDHPAKLYMLRTTIQELLDTD